MCLGPRDGSGGWHSDWYADFEHKELGARHKLDDKSQVHRLISFGKRTAARWADRVMPTAWGYAGHSQHTVNTHARHRLGGGEPAPPAPLRSADSLPASPGPLHRAATEVGPPRGPPRPSTAPAQESPSAPAAAPIPSDTPAALPAADAQPAARLVLESYASNRTPAAPEAAPEAARANPPESPLSGWRSVTPPLKVRRRNSVGARPRGPMPEGEDDDLPLSARATATRKSQGMRATGCW